MNPEEVTLKYYNDEGDLVETPATQIDGTLWTTGSWFSKQSSNLGMPLVGQVKTAIRHIGEYSPTEVTDFLLSKTHAATSL